jgi:hypothetical protein
LHALFVIFFGENNMTPMGPRKGDLVVHENSLYFFQPNGTSCYLYLKLENVGKSRLADKTASISSVEKATEEDMKLIVNPTPKPSPREPLELLYKLLKIDFPDSDEDESKKTT